MALPETDGFTSDLQRIFAMRLLSEAETLVKRAADCGLVLTIEQVNQQPRMGGYRSVAAIRPDLASVRKAYETAAEVEALIAGHTRPLAPKTLERIAKGVEKFAHGTGEA